MNKKEGKGKLYYASGSLFEGVWVNDRVRDTGLLLLANKDRFEGNFIDGSIITFFFLHCVIRCLSLSHLIKSIYK